MRTTTLLRALLTASQTPHYKVAKMLGISPSTLSRHADGVLRKQSVLERAATYFNDTLKLKEPISTKLLQTPLSAQHLVAAAYYAEANAGGQQK